MIEQNKDRNIQEDVTVKSEYLLLCERIHNKIEYDLFATDEEMFTVAKVVIREITWKSSWGDHVYNRGRYEVSFNKFGMELEGTRLIKGSFRQLDSHPGKMGYRLSEPEGFKDNN